jgi:hypothetical protein
MEKIPGNALIIDIICATVLPEEREKYNRWFNEVYFPRSIQLPWTSGIDRYASISDSPDELIHGITIFHLPSITAWTNMWKEPEVLDYLKDSFQSFHRESIWQGTYYLVQSFRKELTQSGQRQTTLIENAPIMHFAGFRLPPEVSVEYNTWFEEYGARVYVPILMKLPGLKGIDRYKYTGIVRLQNLKEPECPIYLTLSYFENMEAFVNFEHSPELEAFRLAIKSNFKGGLDYKFHLTFRLTKSFRK